MPVASSTDDKPPRGIRPRLVSQWWLKVLLTIVLGGAFLPYFLLQQFPLGTPRTPPSCVLDDVARFDPRWVFVYQSIYLPFNLVPWLCWRRDQLVRYTRGYLVLLGVSFAIFAFFPSLGPVRGDATGHGLYDLLCTLDTRGNACPSLHAGLIAYTFVVATSLSLRSTSLVVLALWSMVTLYSTLALRQHYAIDLLAGGVLGLACGAVAGWVPMASSVIGRTASRSRREIRGDTSHDGSR